MNKTVLKETDKYIIYQYESYGGHPAETKEKKFFTVGGPLNEEWATSTEVGEDYQSFNASASRGRGRSGHTMIWVHKDILNAAWID